MHNRFEIQGRDAIIYLEDENGNEIKTFISVLDLDKARDFIGVWKPAWSEGTQSYYVKGYGGLVNREKKYHSLHRWLMDEPEGFVVDHINHDTLNNRFGNLRIVSQAVNALNKKANVGVTKYKDRWKGQFKFKGETYLIGYFDTEEEARAKVDEAREELIDKETFYDEYDNDINYFNKQVRGLL